MFANVVTLRYKSAGDLEQAMKRAETLIPDVKAVPGFRSIHFVRTGDAETTHMAVYDDPTGADYARRHILPRLADMIGDHLAGPPDARSGDVALSG